MVAREGIGGRATGSARRTSYKGKFTRLAMTDKEATQWLLMGNDGDVPQTGVACYVIVWGV